MDFSEFEYARGGIWRICAVIAYLDDLRADHGVMDVVDADDEVIGEAPAPIAVVTDNGPSAAATPSPSNTAMSVAVGGPAP